MSDHLSHFDPEGKAIMVDVGEKPPTRRTAVARGAVRMRPETLRRILDRSVEKGDVFAVARLAGIMAAKQTATLIPLCHHLPISSAEITFTPAVEQSEVNIEARVRVTDRTGVEMEALTAVAIAALTIYDMCKAIDREMVITEVKLVEKSGGKSGEFLRNT